MPTDFDNRIVRVGKDLRPGLTAGGFDGAVDASKGFQGLVVEGAGTAADGSWITFYRQGAIIKKFGYDADNILKVGSYGGADVFDVAIGDGRAYDLLAYGLAGDATNWTTWRNRQNTVAAQLGWQGFKDNHTIIDGSDSKGPSGQALSNTDAGTPWQPGFPILMGWAAVTNQTYGLRVDSARLANDLAISLLPLLP